MNIRGKFSIILFCYGLILVVFDLTGNLTFKVKPGNLIDELNKHDSYYTVDQVARIIVSEEPGYQIIDLRSPDDFRSFNIPGSVNIPYKELLKTDPSSFLANRKVKTIFYSNGDFESNYALVYALGLKYENAYVMKGGLNEWFSTVMNSSFKGERISARENALFEARSGAKKMFNEINSLPDSLKQKFFESKHLAAKKLDGGCE
jgi:rhodanese-related sulfurtransferase